MENSEEINRRKRINRYKKTIIIVLMIIILLPSVLCAILFSKIGGLEKRVSTVSEDLYVLNSQYDVKLSEIEGMKQSIEQSYLELSQAMSVNDNKQIETTLAEDATNEVVVETYPDLPEKELVEYAIEKGNKVVYLTFDDGPCSNTEKLIDVLDSYGVKATFFINGFEGYEEQLKRIVDEGHTLAMHTYSHQPEIVYKSLRDFKKDVKKLQDYIFESTDYKSTIFRFPGGSSTTQSKVAMKDLIKYLDDSGITFFDWNVSSGDGADGLSEKEIYNNVMSGIMENDISVVLMHDSLSRKSTFDALPEIIESLQALNALILPITMDTEPVHHNIK